MKLKEKWSQDWWDKNRKSKDQVFSLTETWLNGFEFAKSELKKALHYDENAYEIIDKLGEEEVETK